MLMMLVAVGLAGVTAYIWCIRGFFSALIHMVCVFAAGAVAFGVWEPVTGLIMDVMPERGFFAPIGEMAYGLGLAIPFGLALAIFRGIVDSLLPANAQCEGVADYIGGGVCGAVSGVISAGIMVLSIGMLRAEPDFMGYQSVLYSSVGRGSIERTSEKMIPWVDRITAGMYSHLSLTTMRTQDPLAVWYPSFDTFPGANRLTYDNRSRTTLKPDSFQVMGTYIVGDKAKPAPFDQLTPDELSPTPHKMSDILGREFGRAPENDGDPDLSRGYLAGVIVKFNSKAREKTGQVVIGNGQVRLVVRSQEDDDSTLALHPVAVVTNVDDPTRRAFAHFRINVDGTFTSSVGGAAEAIMGFEFPVPQGYDVLAVYVKGVRVDLSDRNPSATYPDPVVRDAAISTGAMEAMNDIGINLDESGKPIERPQASTFSTPMIVVTNSLGFTIQKSQEQGITVQQETRGWSVADGEQTFSLRSIQGTQGMDPKLKIDRFAVTEDRVVVKVNVTPSHRNREFNQAYEAADRNAEPVLLDSNGTRYPAVGFIYKDSTVYKLRYMQGSPIAKLSEIPAISQSQTDRELTIVFVVSAGVTITDFKIGETSMPTDLAKTPIKADRGR